MNAWLIFILLNGYAYHEGVTHGILYACKGANAFPGNEHRVFVACRGALVLVLLLATRIDTETAFILTLCYLLSFSFWHNGAYYITRHQIDPGQKTGWFSQSDTDTAKIKFGSLARTVTFVLSLIILIIYTIYRS